MAVSLARPHRFGPIQTSETEAWVRRISPSPCWHRAVDAGRSQLPYKTVSALIKVFDALRTTSPPRHESRNWHRRKGDMRPSRTASFHAVLQAMDVRPPAALRGTPRLAGVGPRASAVSTHGWFISSCALPTIRSAGFTCESVIPLQSSYVGLAPRHLQARVSMTGETRWFWTLVPIRMMFGD